MPESALLESAPLRTVIVAAHPDDEVIGIGARFAEIGRIVAMVHVTDGAPRSGDDFRNAGCETWQQYAALRRTEFENALAASGVRSENNICLWYPEQQVSFTIEEVARELARIFERLRPEVVFTHPYEGGHPDHDAVAAAVHGAKCLLESRVTFAEAESAPCRFTLVEFASYHAGPAGFEGECFLENGPPTVLDVPLTMEERARKRGILECYTSQQRTLSQFPLQREPIRQAPEYDFTRPPHQGTLFYEQFDWGITGAEWRILAAKAFQSLNIETPNAGE